MVVRAFGMGEFCKIVRLTPPIVRGLEAAGVVSPVKTTSGWRAFSSTDVDSARAWREQNARGGRRA